jgi:pre-mRNA-splicing factor SYF1
VNCEDIIRHGIRLYTDEVGHLWVCLAQYFIRLGIFQKARDIFEEALSNVIIIYKLF